MTRIFRRNGNTPHDENQEQNGSTHGHTNGATNGQPHAASSSNGAATSIDQTETGVQEPALVDPITAAEALQVDLRAALASTGRLLQALRRNRKQARLVETTLQSLRQLQGV